MDTVFFFGVRYGVSDQRRHALRCIVYTLNAHMYVFYEMELLNITLKYEICNHKIAINIYHTR